IAAARGTRAKKKKTEEADVHMQQVVRVAVPISAKDVATIILETEPIKANLTKALPDLTEGDDEDDDPNAAAFAGVPGFQKKGPLYFEYSAQRTGEMEQKAYGAALKLAREKAMSLALASG